jgi:uncharacterized membrane protein YhaH (DUF805 family)
MKLLLSPSGRLARGRFFLAVLAVYAAGLVSQMLTAPVVLERAGLWPFAAAQLIILWSWYALHARRLRDAGRSPGLALGIAIIYLLCLVLLLMVLFFFMMPEGSSGDTVPASSFVALYLLLWVFGAFGDRPSAGIVEFYAFLLLAAAAAPFILAFGCTLWAGTRGSAPPDGGAPRHTGAPT